MLPGQTDQACGAIGIVVPLRRIVFWGSLKARRRGHGAAVFFPYPFICKDVYAQMQTQEFEHQAATPYQAVIFDLDGTLLNSLEDLADAANAALEGFGFPRHPVASYRQFVGDGVRVLLRRALPEQERTEQAVTRCLEVFTKEYRQGWNRKSVPYPGILELLGWLRDQGLALAVLSNKPATFIQEIMDYYFADWGFDPVYGASPEFPRKPDPAGVERIADKLGLPPAKMLFMGDSNVDMQTAKNAGAFAVGALWGFRGADELAKAGADLLLEHPMDLTTWFGQERK